MHKHVPLRLTLMRALLPLLLPAAALAQQAPLAPQVTPRDLRPDTPPQPAVALPQQQAGRNVPPPNADKLFVRVGGFVFTDGFAELAADSERLVALLRGQRISVADFYQLADAVEALYHDAGYPLVRIVVPPQAIVDDGSLTLTVLDGYIESLELKGVPPRARALVSRIMSPLVGRRHLRGAALERALTLAGRGPGLSLRSALGAGTAAGATMLVLEGEHTVFSGSLATDNRLSAAMGNWQETLQLRLNQPLSFGEQWYLYVSGGVPLRTAAHNEAPRRVGGGGLILPLNADGLSLNPEFTVSDTKPRTEVALLQSRSQLERLTLRLVYPAIVNRSQELTVTAVLDASRQTDALPNFGYTMDVDRLRVGRLMLDWNGDMDTARLGAGATFSRGTPLLGARSNDDVAGSGIPLSRAGAESGFAKIEAYVHLDLALPWGMQGKSVLRGQRALSGVMPSGELFSLDGEDALSTFSSGALSNDGGWTARQEVSRPFDLASVQARIEPYLFAATGKASSMLAVPGAMLANASYGIGLRANWKTLSVSGEFGHWRLRPAGVNETSAFIKAQVQF
jgi:hemolysin activation/secretion protein